MAAATLCSGPAALAIEASPHPVEVTQPDGTKITVYIRGNEGIQWEEDADGYTVLRDRGRYVYARRGQNGRLTPTNQAVGRANPRAIGLQKRILPDQSVIDAMVSSGPMGASSNDGSGSSGPELAQAVATKGTVKNLVVLMRFADHVGRGQPARSQFDTLFNAIGGHATLAPTGSIRDVYYENSYGALTMNSTVVAWVTLPKTEAYYADGVSGLGSRTWEALRAALDLVDGAVNFNQFDENNDGAIDFITFLHSGYGAEWGGTDAFGGYYADRIWSHRWSIWGGWTSAEGVSVTDYHISPAVWGRSGSAIGRIGVIAHETGHFLGLPDLYDGDGSGGQGIGSYGMMANSWGFDGSQLYPPHFSPWSKIRLGWITPTEITQAGVYSVPAVEATPKVYKVTEGYPSDEYLLIENRQPIGFDGAMPQGGLAVWHIDEKGSYNTEGYPGQTGWPGNGSHYRIALLQADGNFGLEKGFNRGDSGDLYHGNGVNYVRPNSLPNTDSYQGGNIVGTGIEITSISPSSSTMSFTFQPTQLGPGYCIMTGRAVRYFTNASANVSYLYLTPRTVGIPSFGYYFQIQGTNGALSNFLASPQLRRNMFVKVKGDENCPSSGKWRYGGVLMWGQIYGLY